MRFGHRFESRYYQKSTLTEDLIVAWPLDEAGGTRYPDYGGTEFNLTDVNTVGTADAPSGIGGLCASFDGATEYLSCPDPFPPPAALSVSAWVYRVSGIGSTLKRLLRQGHPNTLSWGLHLATLLPAFIVTTNGTVASATIASAAGSIPNDTWALVTATWDGARITVYNNLTPGTPVAFSSTPYDSASALALGAGNVDVTPGDFFGGRIAQPLIWRRAITLAEITYLYNSGNGRPLTDWL